MINFKEQDPIDEIMPPDQRPFSVPLAHHGCAGFPGHLRELREGHPCRGVISNIGYFGHGDTVAYPPAPEWGVGMGEKTITTLLAARAAAKRWAA
ncbi:hypothetical protein [Zoogloea sp.]|uniref:hypothetical protein n=1 Tax=Zoogloea sp. TaxID=49181 RepID=UPI001D4796CD|nr:hypothetical protein [Zoogloea sp.]MBK6652380.1 hypothetical protein [Zoogloea sp.]